MGPPTQVQWWCHSWVLPLCCLVVGEAAPLVSQMVSLLQYSSLMYSTFHTVLPVICHFATLYSIELYCVICTAHAMSHWVIVLHCILLYSIVLYCNVQYVLPICSVILEHCIVLYSTVSLRTSNALSHLKKTFYCALLHLLAICADRK